MVNLSSDVAGYRYGVKIATGPDFARSFRSSRIFFSMWRSIYAVRKKNMHTCTLWCKLPPIFFLPVFVGDSSIDREYEPTRLCSDPKIPRHELANMSFAAYGIRAYSVPATDPTSATSSTFDGCLYLIFGEEEKSDGFPIVHGLGGPPAVQYSLISVGSARMMGVETASSIARTRGIRPMSISQRDPSLPVQETEIMQIFVSSLLEYGDTPNIHILCPPCSVTRSPLAHLHRR